MKRQHFTFLALFVLITSCIGFDEIFEPLELQPRITLQAKIRALMVGDSLQLEANFFNEKGEVESGDFVWTSSKPNVISVNANGLIIGKQIGQSVLQVSRGSVFSNTVLISVNDSNSLAFIEISTTPQTNLLFVDDNISFSARGLNVAMEEIPGLIFKWTSSDNKVLSIDSITGMGKAVSRGKTNITAKVDDFVSDDFEVNVISDLIGTFVSSPGNESYNIKGSVEVGQVGDAVEIRFKSDFSVKSAPGPYVYLSNKIHSTANALKVAELPKNGNPITGPFSFTTQAGVSVNDYKFVIVYCEPFSIPFGSAELK